MLTWCAVLVLCAAEGDTLRTWRIDPFIMIERGQAWVPPPMLAADIAAGAQYQYSLCFLC